MATEALAKQMQVPFVGLWMDAPLSVREERVKTRLRNPSDVRDRAELDSQLQLNIGEVRWHKIMTDKTREKTLQEALRALRHILHPHRHLFR